MKKQAFNPFLPLNEYMPDNEPHVFGDRVYVYGSHDKENGHDYCLLDYVCYSAPVDDLSDWHYEGVIYERTQDPTNRNGVCELFSPDVCMGPDGKYYLYYPLNGKGVISIAVCDTPSGKFSYYGIVQYDNGNAMREANPFSPAVINHNGEIYLYFGFAPTAVKIRWYEDSDLPGCSVVKLESDMKTVAEGPKMVIPSQQYSQNTSFFGHEYFEAPSIRYIDGTFYMVYSSIKYHELCYATSQYPDRGFEYGGVIISNGDIGLDGREYALRANYIGNNHGGMVKIKDQWYIFYHRHTHGTAYSRQGCAEPITILPDGSINQVEITSCGLNNGPLKCNETYPATICCHLSADSEREQILYGLPYITSKDDTRFVTHISNGAKVGYKYFDVKDASMKVRVTYQGIGEGELFVSVEEFGPAIGKIIIKQATSWMESSSHIEFPVGINALYFEYVGKGSIQLLKFFIGFDI